MSHLEQANHNHSLLADLLPKVHQFPDWIATVAFYKALHVVEAVFACENPSRHGTDHPDRDRCLKQTNRYSKIYQHYRPLTAASMVARYMGQGHANFSAYMTPKQVFDNLISNDLHQLERAATKFLKTPAVLVTVSSSAFSFPAPHVNPVFIPPVANPNSS